MTAYENATLVQERVIPLLDMGQLTLRLLRGEAGDSGRHCIHRIQTDSAGRLKSDIVYFYDPSVNPAHAEADMALLARGGLISVGSLHHTESMLNRGPKMSRRA